MMYTITVRIRHTSYGPPLRLHEYYADPLLAQTAYASWEELCRTPGSIVEKVDMLHNRGNILVCSSHKGTKKDHGDNNSTLSSLSGEAPSLGRASTPA